MSYYYDLTLNVLLRGDTPSEVIATLSKMFAGEHQDIRDPHPFFKEERWHAFPYGYHTDSDTVSVFTAEGDDYRLTLDIEVNYGYTPFLQMIDWLMPYMIRPEDGVIGTYQGEGGRYDLSPSKVMLRENGTVMHIQGERLPDTVWPDFSSR